MLHYPGDGSGTVAQATALIDKYHPGGYLVFASMFENNTTAGVQKKIADTQAASDIRCCSPWTKRAASPPVATGWFG